MDHPLDELQEEIKDILTEKRFLHTLGVCHTAACLAMCYKADIKKASVAGLLHDCAKCLPDEEIKKRCKQYQIEMTEVEERNPYLLHGKLGAYYAKMNYGIEDTDILNAIIYHTTGRPGMTLLEKIVFIADYIEAGRKDIPGLSEIRNIVFHDIDRAIYMVLENTLNYLNMQVASGQQRDVDSMTLRAYEYYKDSCNTTSK